MQSRAHNVSCRSQGKCLTHNRVLPFSSAASSPSRTAARRPHHKAVHVACKSKLCRRVTGHARRTLQCNAAASMPGSVWPSRKRHKLLAGVLLAPALIFGVVRVALSLLDVFQTAALEIWLVLGYIVWPAEAGEDAGSELEAAMAPDEDDELVVVCKGLHDWLWSMLAGSSTFAEGLMEVQLWWETDPWGQRLQRFLLLLPTSMLVAGRFLNRFSSINRQLALSGVILSSNCAMSSSFGIAGGIGPALAICSTSLHVINTAVAFAGVLQLFRKQQGSADTGGIVPTLAQMSMWLLVGRAVVEAIVGYAGERETVPANAMLSNLEHWGLVARPLVLALPSLLLLMGNPLPWLSPLFLITTIVSIIWRDWP